MERTRWLMVIVLVFGLTAGVTNAGVIAVENFEYDVGQSLDGLDGGTGWDGAWPVNTGAVIAAGSLTAGGTGNHVKVVDNAGGGEAWFERDLATPLLDDGSTYWVSLWFQKSTADYTDCWSGFLLGDNIWFGKGYDGEYIELWDDEDGEGDDTDVLATELSWVVLKIETNPGAQEQVYLWVNPGTGAEPSTAFPDAQLEIALGDEVPFVIEYGDYSDTANAVDYTIDEIKIGDSWYDVAPNPKLASSPVPAEFEENVDPNILKLEWTAPAEVCDPNYDVYFGTDTPPTNNIATGISDPCTLTPPGDLAPDTQYYWRVDVNDPNCDAQCENCVPEYVMLTGSEWTFTTWPSTPIILTQPEDTLVSPGGTAEFSVESGGNLAGSHTFTWYKQAGDTQDEPNDLVVKAETTEATGISTLEVTDAQYDTDPLVSDGGLYYCKVHNDIGGTYAISAFADLGGPLPNQVQATTADHGGEIVAGSYVTITGTTNYNGTYQVTNVSGNTNFDFMHTWEGTEAGNVTCVGTAFSDSASLGLLRLMAWYRFNGNADDSASNYDATKVGGGYPGGGIQGNCINLDGVDDYLYVPDIIGGETVGTFEAFTIAAWVNPDVGEEAGVILAGYDDTGEGDPITGGDGISIERTADGTALVRIVGNTPATVVSSGANAIPASAPVSEVQTSTLDNLMTAGTFTMTYKGQTTTDIAFDATKNQITAALNALSTVSPGNITMQTAHEPDTELTCTWTFASKLGDVPMLSMDVSGATGPTSADFVETTKGYHNWTYVVFVYDSNDVVGTGTVYINGEPDAQAEYSSVSAQQIGPFSMGAYLPDGGSPMRFLDGRLDEVRIYAYAITAVNVASLYNEMTGESACAGNPEFDLNDSCTVELVDYAKVLSNWLGCNIVPTCLP